MPFFIFSKRHLINFESKIYSMEITIVGLIPFIMALIGLYLAVQKIEEAFFILDVMLFPFKLMNDIVEKIFRII